MNIKAANNHQLVQNIYKDIFDVGKKYEIDWNTRNEHKSLVTVNADETISTSGTVENFLTVASYNEVSTDKDNIRIVQNLYFRLHMNFNTIYVNYSFDVKYDTTNSTTTDIFDDYDNKYEITTSELAEFKEIITKIYADRDAEWFVMLHDKVNFIKYIEQLYRICEIALS